MSTGAFPNLPALVAHADWSTHPCKRWMASAALHDGVYTARAPQQVTHAGSLLADLQTESGGHGPLLAGFDFPIGLPAAYASRVGITDFLAWLPQMGTGIWANFDKVAHIPAEITLHRPFFPHRSLRENKQHFLLSALGVDEVDRLFRVCELRSAFTQAASPLFWTVGGKQVGKAALAGWREILIPALHDNPVDVAIWPFAGALPDLLASHQIVVVETYPGEMYHHVGVTWPKLPGEAKSGKGSQSARRRNASPLKTWANASGVKLQSALADAIDDGFGAHSTGEDQFDAVIGLFGMLNVLLGRRGHDAPDDEVTRNIEGWIFGRAASNI